MKAKAASITPLVRCAIYTRKSSDEGLDQAFNSLHAQREACEAYIRSQVGEGWKALPAEYDDGGFSGGNLDRPALRRLLADIAAGKVDTVVVYKIDRLTRSLADFAKIVEQFDAADVSFVSITQAFNTTTSMGRLTLNILLSFAQFEREVTGERIRDKIAQSKAKGMWMGGRLPLGYDIPTDQTTRALVVNPAEAETVKQIFSRYLELGSVNALREELLRNGVRSKAWLSAKGEQQGGVPIGRGGLFHMLQNRVYLGEITHGDLVHPGRHPAIVDRDVFEAVALRPEANTKARSTRPSRAASLALTSKLYDATGVPMSPSLGYGRGGRLYRYYISMPLQLGRSMPKGDGVIRRVAADPLEAFMLKPLQRLADRPTLETADLASLVRRADLRLESTEILVDAAALFADRHRRIAFQDLQGRLQTDEHAVWEDGEMAAIRIVLPCRLQLRGGRTQLAGGAEALAEARINPGLLAGLRSAHQELLDLNASPLSEPAAFDRAAAPTSPHRRQLSRLPFLAPDLQRMILEGRQPAKVKLRTLLISELPLDWDEQRRWFARMAA